jgi:hypothetical protein
MNNTHNFKTRVLYYLKEKEDFHSFPIADPTSLIDLLAIRNGETRGYRVKAHGRIYQKELQTLRRFAQKLGISVFIAKETTERGIRIWDLEQYARTHV